MKKILFFIGKTSIIEFCDNSATDLYTVSYNSGGSHVVQLQLRYLSHQNQCIDLRSLQVYTQDNFIL